MLTPGSFRPRRSGKPKPWIISDEELAIICDLMSGWGTQWVRGRLDDKKSRLLIT